MSTSAETAYKFIRSSILSGRYGGGKRLKEQEIASALAISRTPVREALRQLHSEGLVDFVANRGAYVLNWNNSDVDEVFELRMVLESFAAELAAVRHLPEQLAELRDLADRMIAAARERPARYLEMIAEWNTRFHKLVHIASGIKRLSTILTTVIEIPSMLRTFNRYSDEDLERSMAHHRELVAALEARDSRWASSVMRSHIVAAHHVFLGNDAATRATSHAA